MSNTPPETEIDQDQPNSTFSQSLDGGKELEEMTEEELLNKVVEFRDLSKRLAADYQNLQKETEQRLSNARKYATEGLILEIAPLVDYFDSAFAAVPEAERDSNWMQGIRYIQDHLIKILDQHNVKIIATVGKEFNPEFHEAVSEEASDAKPHTIIKQVQAGFTLHDKVIKHAKVIVAAEPNLIIT